MKTAYYKHTKACRANVDRLRSRGDDVRLPAFGAEGEAEYQAAANAYLGAGLGLDGSNDADNGGGGDGGGVGGDGAGPSHSQAQPGGLRDRRPNPGVGDIPPHPRSVRSKGSGGGRECHGCPGNASSDKRVS